MATIYALLVGIDDYPERPLAGCVNDVLAFKDYLEAEPGREFIASNDQPGKLAIKMLLAPGSGADAGRPAHPGEEVIPAELPTRENLIAAFHFFDEAKDGDTCVFYYSGHGSFSVAPPEFHSSNGYVQSFVCYDSRRPGGRDLMDKEMGFLIWKTMVMKPGVNFVAITDCCHSGTITKAVDNKRVTDRLAMTDDRHVPARVEEYLGFEVVIDNKRAYEDTGSGNDRRVTPLQGRHIHLAASQNRQTSKELLIDGSVRGAFTYSLLKVLYASNGQLNYIDLLGQVQASVRGLVDDQEPDVQVRGELLPSEKEKLFLAQEYASSNPKYVVYYDRKYGWSLAGGQVHGIAKGDVVRIPGVCNTVVTGFSGADRSIVMGMLELGTRDKRYVAEVEAQPDQALLVSLAPDIDPAVADLIRQARVAAPSPFVSLVAEPVSRAIIRTGANGLTCLTLPGSTRPYFEPAAVRTSAEAVAFLHKVDKVGRWSHLLAFDNPRPRLSQKDYSLRLFVTVEAGDYTAAGMPEVERKAVNVLNYLQSAGSWYQPAFRLVIKNHSQVTLYITAVYLGFDFSITPASFEDLDLGAGAEQELRYIGSGGKPQAVVKAQLDARYRNLGYTAIMEYLKLFISTRKISVDRLKQEGLNIPRTKSIQTRSIQTKGITAGPATEAWRAETVGFKIVRV
jgi:hypothetical protein